MNARPAAPAAGRYRMLLLFLLLPVLLTACGGGDHTPPVKVLGPTPDLHGTRLTTPFREPDLTLTGTSGRPVNLIKATEGKLTLVYFGYTHCPDVCPTTMADLAGALRLLTPAQREKIAVVFVTSDPWRDTPKVIKSWLASFNPGFIGLTGDYAKIQTAASRWGSRWRSRRRRRVSTRSPMGPRWFRSVRTTSRT
jgi:protein SCO1/2